MAPGPSIRIRRRMVGRDIDEDHRVSSPLELLFDLTFVVAIAQVAAQLAHRVSDGEALSGIGPYLMVFFAIWWAWLNFTWFASAYDTDDVPYRLTIMVQMAGVLVLAAGVPTAFANENFLGVTIGYLIMRVAAVGQWLRAAIENPDGRQTAFRYAAAIAIVQLGWVARLLLPTDGGVWGFVVLVLAEISIPIFAERTGTTNWHPQHIAERYGLFTIILLGESVSAATIAAVGTALEVAVDAGNSELSSLVVGYALAIPVAVFFVLLSLLHAVIEETTAARPIRLGIATAMVLVIPLAASTIGVPATIGLIAVVAAALATVSIIDNARCSAIPSTR